jgi:HlyD family secretion protein
MQPIPIRRVAGTNGATRVVASPPARRRSEPRRFNPWIVVAAVATLAASVATVTLLRSRVTEQKPSARIASVTRGSVVGLLRVAGRLQTQTVARVGSMLPGQLVDVTVSVGEKVRQGQVLARLDDLEQRAALADARAQVNAAELRRVRTEKRLLEQLGALHEKGKLPEDLSPEDIVEGAAGDSQLDLMTSLVNVGRTETRRALARAMLARRVVRSPLAGIVLARAVDPGETITASPPGPPLFVIGSDPARLRLEVEIDEASAARIHPGPARFIVAAYPTRTFEGAVRQLLPVTALALTPGRFRVVLDVDNKDGALQPGMSATVSLPMESSVTALRVPVGAVTAVGPLSGAQATIQILDRTGSRISTHVETGVTNGHFIEIRGEGVVPGTPIAVEGPAF